MNSATTSSEKTVQDYVQTAKSIEEISNAAEHLNTLTEELSNVLNKFKT